MATRTQVVEVPGSHGVVSPPENVARSAVLLELENILSSRPFRNSSRGKQFLSYVVLHKLDHRDDLLKERTIGVEVFQRPAGYATGDDPVVRVQAGEVRRRLEQYYHAVPTPTAVRIELPVGSYAPEFHWEHESIGHEGVTLRRRPRWVPWLLTALGILGVLGTAEVAFKASPAKATRSVLNEFWAPIFSTSQPVLICLGRTEVYRPSDELYKKFTQKHPSAFQSELDRLSEPLPLDPQTKLTWGDMVRQNEFGVAIGDTQATALLSGLFTRINKPSQVRIGATYSFEDLRNSPSILVGAFNNHWTLQLTSNLHFAFTEKNGVPVIEERVPQGRTWFCQRNASGEPTHDYAVVTRVLDSKTGQLLIALAGVGGHGTRVAGEFVSREDFLQEALRSAPPDWQKKNMQVVLETVVTDTVAGPPRVVATYYW